MHCYALLCTVMHFYALLCTAAQPREELGRLMAAHPADEIAAARAAAAAEQQQATAAALAERDHAALAVAADCEWLPSCLALEQVQLADADCTVGGAP